MIRGWKEVEDSNENDKRGIVDKSSNRDMLESAFNFDSDAILLGYRTYAGHTERLYRHNRKVRNMSFPTLVCNACVGIMDQTRTR